MENKTFIKKLRMWALGLMIPAMPMISKGLPVYTNTQDGGVVAAGEANSPDFSGKFRSAFTPSQQNPVWLAYDLSSIPDRLRARALFVWYNEETSPYDHTLITEISNPGYNNPGAYTMEANKEAGGKVPEKGWIKLASVENNTFHSRQHTLDLSGYNWVRIVFTAVDGSKDNMIISVNTGIYSAGKKGADDWIFYGDSITQMAMNHESLNCPEGEGTFSMLVNNMAGRFFPVQENGGTGYMKSTDGAKHIGEWLKLFPGKFVAIAYGTNDAWNMMDPEEFYANYETMVKMVLQAGKIPFVPVSIPWSSSQKNIQDYAPILNGKIAELMKKYQQIIKGPDFFNIFKNNPELLSADGVHPSRPEGLFVYRNAWARAAYNAVYSGNK